jgi:hypothetical protein
LDEYIKYLIDIEPVVVAAAALAVIGKRNSSIVWERQHLEICATNLLGENEFWRFDQMEKESFSKLVSFTKSLFALNEDMSRQRTNMNHPILIELILHCTLCYLAGSFIDDIQIKSGISRPLFYQSIHQGDSLILACMAYT